MSVRPGACATTGSAPGTRDYVHGGCGVLFFGIKKRRGEHKLIRPRAKTNRQARGTLTPRHLDTVDLDVKIVLFLNTHIECFELSRLSLECIRGSPKLTDPCSSSGKDSPDGEAPGEEHVLVHGEHLHAMDDGTSRRKEVTSATAQGGNDSHRAM